MPDILYCVVDGTSLECGFLIDLEPEVFEWCMSNNFYSSLYPAQAVLRMWSRDDVDAELPPAPKPKKIVVFNSSAALIPAPGYVAYSGEYPRDSGSPSHVLTLEKPQRQLSGPWWIRCAWKQCAIQDPSRRIRYNVFLHITSSRRASYKNRGTSRNSPSALKEQVET